MFDVAMRLVAQNQVIPESDHTKTAISPREIAFCPQSPPMSSHIEVSNKMVYWTRCAVVAMCLALVSGESVKRVTSINDTPLFP